jgi:hypothetical protein
MSCLLIRSNAEPGLSSFSATGLGFAALADAFFALGFAPSLSAFVLYVERLRGGFFAGASPPAAVASFRGTFETDVRDWKNSLATSRDPSSTVFVWYCSVAMSVMVRGFFLGALHFSGEEFLEFG